MAWDWKDFAEDVTLGADRASAPIQYFPFLASWRGDWSGEGRSSDLSVSAVFGVRGLGDGWERFDAKRYKARPSFVALKLDGSHTEDLAYDLQLSTRFTGQWSPDPLISNEGFSLGGVSTVRGYYESEALGDYGFAVQAEMRSPDFGSRVGLGVDEFRLHAFWDAGYAGIHDPLIGQDDSYLLSSAGLGGRIRLLTISTAPSMSARRSSRGRRGARVKFSHASASGGILSGQDCQRAYAQLFRCRPVGRHAFGGGDACPGVGLVAGRLRL